jgi:hypothetical protein
MSLAEVLEDLCEKVKDYTSQIEGMSNRDTLTKEMIVDHVNQINDAMKGLQKVIGSRIYYKVVGRNRYYCDTLVAIYDHPIEPYTERRGDIDYKAEWHYTSEPISFSELSLEIQQAINKDGQYVAPIVDNRDCY